MVLLRPACAFAIVLMLVPEPARAQASTPPPLSEALSGPARTAFASAKLLFANQDFGGALAEFTQAYDLSKDPRLLFNMAICEKNLHRYARMQQLLRQYQHEGGVGLTAENRTVVEDALRAIENLVGLLVVSVNEPGATVSLDGAVLATTPVAGPIPVDIGPHSLVVAKPGFETITQPIRVAGGSALTVNLSLVKASHVARLTVTAETTAMIQVDGAPTAGGRFDGSLPSGTHQVRVTATAKVPYVASVDLRDGETRTLEVVLENERAALLWPWLVGGAAVVAAGAAVGGYYLFKPGPAAPGAPPPGKLGTVSFSAIRF